jgi:hypothetical protein
MYEHVPFIKLEVEGQCYLLPLSNVDQSIDPKVKLIRYEEMTNLGKKQQILLFCRDTKSTTTDSLSKHMIVLSPHTFTTEEQ